ncbi:DUF3791 domain-containing protein [Clostridium grantii]|uniref:DUF3791 domain-containing protein n=1 Tax=Clostridium grantii DSM 8605 TaxID=1121316 RepID=A0A1M5Y9V2_9CLOT|nr:DUF3791 domain-containing protein [Clostridium grantii]SHI08608.1 Protein of unknown function [Clostridium grantii DSM 8605]
MNRSIDFTVFCLESYKRSHNITGKDALKIFNDNKVFDYIKSFYDVLHSTGQDYIVEDIDVYINSRRN